MHGRYPRLKRRRMPTLTLWKDFKYLLLVYAHHWAIASKWRVLGNASAHWHMCAVGQCQCMLYEVLCWSMNSRLPIQQVLCTLPDVPHRMCIYEHSFHLHTMPTVRTREHGNTTLLGQMFHHPYILECFFCVRGNIWMKILHTRFQTILNSMSMHFVKRARRVVDWPTCVQFWRVSIIFWVFYCLIHCVPIAHCFDSWLTVDIGLVVTLSCGVFEFKLLCFVLSYSSQSSWIVCHCVHCYSRMCRRGHHQQVRDARVQARRGGTRLHHVRESYHQLPKTCWLVVHLHRHAFTWWQHWRCQVSIQVTDLPCYLFFLSPAIFWHWIKP